MAWLRRKKKRPAEVPRQPELRVLESERLTLVAANTLLVSLDLENSPALQEILAAEVPPNWPPELYDRPAMKYALRQLGDPAEQRWSFWYLVSTVEGLSQLVGICGFKGRPDNTGSVEIGYSILDQYQNMGYATEAVNRLVAWAFNHHEVCEVSAETLPHLQQSIRVMEKNGFTYTGAGSEMGVVRYAVSRPDR